MSERFDSVQVLRGIAACGVVVCHGATFPVGAAGVDLFFVISGFIIATVMQGRSPTEFLSARIWRVFPLLWICTLPWFFLAGATGLLTWDRLASSLLLWPVFGDLTWPYLRPAWSLCYEMLFYYAATLALLSGRAWWLVFGFVTCFTINLISPTPLSGFLGYPLIFNFLMGAALRRLPKSEMAAWASLAIAIPAILLAPAATFAANTIGVSGLAIVPRVAWWGVPSAMLVYAAITFNRTRLPPILVTLGDASYSIYLVHIGIVTIMPGAVGILLAIAAGLVVHQYVEKPLLALRRATVQRRQVAAQS